MTNTVDILICQEIQIGYKWWSLYVERYLIAEDGDPTKVKNAILKATFYFFSVISTLRVVDSEIRFYSQRYWYQLMPRNISILPLKSLYLLLIFCSSVFQNIVERSNKCRNVPKAQYLELWIRMCFFRPYLYCYCSYFRIHFCHL